MEDTIHLQHKTPSLLIALLSALLLFAIAFLHLQHKATPVTIPQAIELQWANDTSWVRGWE